MSQTDLIDRSALQNLLDMVDGDVDFVDEMIDTFFADTPQLLDTMRNALAAGDAAEVRRAAHSLKSNSSNFGAVQMIALCRDLEERSKNGDLSNGAVLLEQISAAYEQARIALDAQRPSAWEE